MRKTDDNLILQMLREGKTQAEIARTFKVSPVAIHKRLKRLIPKPESLDKLTPKERKFALAVAEGKSRISACMEAFDVATRESAKALQNTLMQKDDIKIAIQELMQIYGLTRGYRLNKLKSLVDHADPGISLKALDQSWKLDGNYQDGSRDAGQYPTSITLVVVGNGQSEEIVIDPVNQSGDESIEGPDNEP